MHFVYLMVLVSVGCEESSTMIPFTSPEIWKRYVVLFVIHAGSSTTKISDCLVVNPKTEQRIWKELDESNDDYEGLPARKPHSTLYDKKNSQISSWDPSHRWQRS